LAAGCGGGDEEEAGPVGWSISAARWKGCPSSMSSGCVWIRFCVVGCCRCWCCLRTEAGACFCGGGGEELSGLVCPAALRTRAAPASDELCCPGASESHWLSEASAQKFMSAIVVGRLASTAARVCIGTEKSRVIMKAGSFASMALALEEVLLLQLMVDIFMLSRGLRVDRCLC